MTSDNQGRFFIGILIIVIGVIFLLGSLDKLDVGDIFANYWPLILIFIGVWQIFTSNFRNIGTGIILIAVGGFFLLANLDILRYSIWSIFWPLLVIGVGVWILFKPKFRGFKGDVPAVRDDDLGAFIMFGGVDRKVESQNFRGGKATALFGGIDLDFTQTKLAGNEATIETTALFGGIDIRVPRDWKVIVDSNAIFGAVEDKHKSEPPAEGQDTLFIKATAIFGGVEIKN